MSSQGLDWAKIRKEYAAKASPSELTTVKRLRDGSEIPIREIDPQTTATTSSTTSGTRHRPKRSWREYGDGSASSIPRGRILALYAEGKTVREIAEHFGVHKSGIYKHLEAAAARGEVKLRDDRRKSARCKRDHPMAEGDPNVRIEKDGSRACRACERLRRERWASKQQTKE